MRLPPFACSVLPWSRPPTTPGHVARRRSAHVTQEEQPWGAMQSARGVRQRPHAALLLFPSLRSFAAAL